MTDKQPMQVPGDPQAAAEEGARGADGASGAGESGGGAYPNPHEHKTGKPHGGFAGHGGQTKIADHRPGQLGDAATAEARDPNAATRKD